MDIVAATCRDVAVMKGDTFYVRHGPDEVHVYDVYLDGRVVKTTPAPLPDRAVSASIEKFNASYRVTPPVGVASLDELRQYVGRFAVTSPTACQLVPAPR